jgi:hypothetical protein
MEATGTVTMTETTAIVCAHVFRNEREAKVVIRHADGTWQLVCGAHDHPQDCADFEVVGLEHLQERQPNLAEIGELKGGWMAEWTDNVWAIAARNFDDGLQFRNDFRIRGPGLACRLQGAGHANCQADDSDKELVHFYTSIAATISLSHPCHESEHVQIPVRVAGGFAVSPVSARIGARAVLSTEIMRRFIQALIILPLPGVLVAIWYAFELPTGIGSWAGLFIASMSTPLA